MGPTEEPLTPAQKLEEMRKAQAPASALFKETAVGKPLDKDPYAELPLTKAIQILGFKTFANTVEQRIWLDINIKPEQRPDVLYGKIQQFLALEGQAPLEAKAYVKADEELRRSMVVRLALGRAMAATI